MVCFRCIIVNTLNKGDKKDDYDDDDDDNNNNNNNNNNKGLCWPDRMKWGMKRRIEDYDGVKEVEEKAKRKRMKWN